MAAIRLAPTAVEDLDRILQTYTLPANTRARVRESLGRLADFPNLGVALGGRWAGFRVLLGPWAWMLLVYVYDEDADEVVVVTVQDARSADAAASDR